MAASARCRTLSFLLAVVFLCGIPAGGQAAPPRAAGGKLPTAQEILDKSLRATGGWNAWLKLTSLHLRAEVSDDTAKNMTGKLEIYAKAPNKISLCVKFSFAFFTCRGYDGKVGWGDDSKDGLTTLDGPRLQEIQAEADFYLELHRATTFAAIKVKGEDVFDGVPVYVLLGTRKDGRTEELYFAKESGFEVGSKELGEPSSQPKTNYLGGYQEIAGVGVKIPTKTRIVNSQMALRISVYEVIANPKMADNVFAKPEKSAREGQGVGIEERPDNGKVVDGVYANQFFGFRYAVPQGWTVHGEETQKVLAEAGKELVAGEDQSKKRLMDAAGKRSYQLLTVFEYPLGTPNKVNRGVQVLAENVAYAPGIQSGKDYLLVMAKGLATTELHAAFEGEPVEETLDGIRFFRQGVNLQVGGKTIHELFFSTVEKGYALSFLFTAQSAEGAEEAARSVGSIRKLPKTTASTQP